MTGKPKAILLATDLSSRCDRALDRAVSLSELWQSKLVILHVLENPQNKDSDPIVPSWRRPPDPVAVAERELLADIGTAITADVIIDEGDTAEAIVRRADTKGCDLIVTGIARDELLGRLILGTTVDRLLRRAPVPILVVKKRVRRPYSHIAVAIDFSKPSYRALEAAIRYFPEQGLTVFHAYNPRGLTTDPAAYRRQYREFAEQEYETFLKSMDFGETIRRQAHSFIEFGTPADVVSEGVRDMNIDLVVLGTQRRSALSEVLVGSAAKQIMAELPCDVLLVSESRIAGEANN